MAAPANSLEHRVLIFAPVGRDGALTRDLLGRSSIPSLVCASLSDLCLELAQQAGAVILTEEALEEGTFPQLKAVLDRQPPWSDISVILFTGSSQNSVSAR